MTCEDGIRRKRLNFKIGDIFPAYDSSAKLVLPLLLSCNDLIYAYRLWSKELGNIDSDPAGAAKSFYLFRLICSHLREAVKALDRAESQPELQKTIQLLSEDGREKLSQLHRYYKPFHDSFTEKLLVPLRNSCFHYYDETATGEALRLLKDENSAILLAEKREGLRILVADEIAVCHSAEIIRKRLRSNLRDAMTSVNELVDVYLNFMEHLLIAYIEGFEGKYSIEDIKD